jgi:hypothetical protein
MTYSQIFAALVQIIVGIVDLTVICMVCPGRRNVEDEVEQKQEERIALLGEEGCDTEGSECDDGVAERAEP